MHRHHERGLVRRAEVDPVGSDHDELREVLGVGLDVLREHLEAEPIPGLDAGHRGLVGIGVFRDDPRGAGRVVHRDHVGTEAVEELLALRQRLPVREHPLDPLETGPGGSQQRVVDADDHLSVDPEQRGAQQEVVGLVHRARLRVLDGHHAGLGLARRDTGEHEPHGLARQRVAVGEQREHGSFAVRAGFSLVGDLHGGASLPTRMLGSVAPARLPPAPDRSTTLDPARTSDEPVPDRDDERPRAPGRSRAPTRSPPHGATAPDPPDRVVGSRGDRGRRDRRDGLRGHPDDRDPGTPERGT